MVTGMLLLFFVAISFVGCGNNKAAQIVTDKDFPALTDTRSEEKEMRAFVTLNGNEVTYNKNTRRIVCVHGSQDVVAFGIKLLAYEGTTDRAGYESFYDGASALKNSTPFSAEEVMSYRPELILVNQRMTSGDIATLSGIAPVIPLYTDSEDFSVRLKYIGNIFGLEDHANKLIGYADALKESMVAQMKSLGLQDKTLTIYTYMGNISIVPERGWFMNTIIYDYLGIKRKDNVKAFMQNESTIAYEPISAENLKQYEGDLVFFAGFGEKTITTYVSENEGWKSLDAVRQNRVGVIDITPYAQKGVLILYNQYYQVMNTLKVAAQIGE